MKKFFSLILLFLVIIITGCQPKVTELEVTFVWNDGTDATIVKVEPGEKLTDLTERARTGYDFGGWYLDADFEIEFDPQSEIQESQTVYVKWIPHEFSIIFAGNGGNHLPTLRIKYDEVLEKPEEEPVRDGYTFIGWYTDKLFKHKFNFGQKVTSSFTLFAGWERIRLPLVDLEEYDVKYIVTSPGEDASTMMNINYQNNNTKSSVEYTLASDTNYQNKKIAYPTGFGFEAIDASVEIPFPYRNINKVNLTNLTPNTSYKYRINRGNNTYTDDYYFTTAGDNKTSFVFITDAHYYDGYDGAEISEEVIKSAIAIQPEIDFIITAGDMVDRGGNAAQWDIWFSHAETFKQMPVAPLPGNHEHSRTGGTKNDISHAFFNVPENSFDEYYGASYYFIHNDTLFINLDNDSTFRRADVYQWLDEVITENPNKFIIVSAHIPFHFVSTAVNSPYNRNLLDIMEKHSVDLVLTGHNHNHSLRTLYQDEDATNNEHLGVNYLNCWASGIKSIGENIPEEFARGYIVDVLEDKIRVRYINARGDILNTYNFRNKKIATVTPATNQALMNSISFTEDNDNDTLTFTWENFFGNVQQVIITEKKYNKHSVVMPIPTPGYTSYTFSKITEDDYEFEVKLIFKDGSSSTKTFKP